MENEIWKPIEGYEGLYEVSSLGNVRSLGNGNSTCSLRKRTKVLYQGKHRLGYKNVSLCKNSKPKMHYVHRLVATAFIPNPNNLPEVNHKDEDKTNNCVENLEWCTREYNINYGVRTEKQIQHPNSMCGRIGKKNHNSKPINQYTKDGKFIEMWDSCMDVQRELNFNNANINKCLIGIYKSAYGYIWKYA